MVSRRSWWRRTLQRFWKAPRHPYRRWPQRSAGLLIEDLEDRTLLSAVVFTGRNITWNGFGATMGPNQPDMHVDGSGMLILTDLSGEAISLTGAPAGWSASGMTAMGPLTAVDDITIDGTAPAPATFVLSNPGVGTIQLTGNFAVTGFDFIQISNSLATPTGGSVSLTATSTLNVANITIAADTQSYRAGDGTGTTAAADLTSASPMFTDSTGSLPPNVFTYRQDATIAAADIPDVGQFPGFLPTTYTIQSDGGSITTPSTTTIFSTSTNLTLDAHTGVTCDWGLDIAALTIIAGMDVTVTSGITTSGDVDINAGGTVTVAGGASISAANVMVTSNMDMSLLGSLSATGTVILGASLGVNESGAGSISAPQLTVMTAFTINLNGPNTVDAFQAINGNVNGGITLDDMVPLLTVTGITLNAVAPVIVNNTGGGMDISGAIHMTIGATLTLTSRGPVTINAPIDMPTSISISAFADVNINDMLMATQLIQVMAGQNPATNTGGINVNSGGGLAETQTGGTGIELVTGTSGGSITLTGFLNAQDPVTLTASLGAISGSGVITADQLTTSSATGTNLTGANVVTSLQATNSGSNGLTFDDTVPLTITGTGVSETGGNVMLADTGGSITVTGPVSDAGNTVSLTASGAVTGAGIITATQLTIQSATGVNLTGNNVVANLQINNSTSGAIVFNDTASTLTLGVITQVGGGDVTITNSGGINVNGKLTMSGGTLQLNSGGTVNVNAPIDPATTIIINAMADANISNSVTATDRIAVFAGTDPVSHTGSVNVLTGGSLTQTTAGRVGIELYTGTTAGSINLSGPLNAQDMVWLTATNNATEMTGGTITAPRLLLLGTGTGTFTLNQANAIGTSTTPGVLAGQLTGSLSFFNNPASTTLTIGTLPRPQGGSNVLGLTSTTGDIALNLNNGLSPLVIGTASNGESITATAGTVDLFAGGVTENPNAVIGAMNLRLRSAGPGPFTFNLGNTNAVTGMLAGNFFGPLVFTNNAGLTVGTVTTAGLNSNGNNITLTLNGGLGLLTIDTPTGPGIVATGATVDLNVGGVNEASAGSVITATALRLRGTGTFNLNPTNPNVVATLAGSFTGALTFRDNSPNPTGLTVGTVLGTVGLTSANNNITLCNSGDILLNQPLNAGTNAGMVTVRLKSGGSVTQGTGVGAMGVITTDNLGVDAVGGVFLDKFANNVSVFAARGSAVAIRFAGLFSLGTVGPANGNDCFTSTITGIMAPSGPQDITICQDTGTLTVNMPLNAGTGTVRLVASNGGVTQTAAGVITAAALGVRATSNASVVTGGDIALDLANNNVGTFAALNTDINRWAIRFLNTNPAGTLVGTVTAASPCFIQTAGVTNTNGDVTLNSNNGMAGLMIGTPPAGGEGITATGGTIDLFAGGVTETAGSIITATNLRLRSAGPGPFTFNLAQTNAISSNLAGDFFGPLTFTNNAAITIASVTLNALTTPDLNSHGNNVTLTLNNGLGLLTINTPTGLGIRAGAATVDLNVGGVTEANATSIITAGGLRLQGTGTFALNQPNIISRGVLPGILVGNFTGPLNFVNTTALTVSTLLGTSGLTSNGNNMILALNGGMSPLTINTPAGPVQGIVAQGANVDINAGGAAELTATSTITAGGLRLRGTGNFTLAQGNTVGTIAGNFTGNLVFVDTIPLTVGTVGTVGLTSTTGSITLVAGAGTAALTIGTPPAGGEGISAANGTVALFAGGATESTGSTITAMSLLIVSGGGGPFAFILNQNNAVGTIAGFVTGNVLFVNTGALVVGTVAVPAGGGSLSGLTSTMGSISLTVGAGTALLSIGTPPPAAEGESITAVRGIVEIFAGGAVEAAGSTVNAYALLIRSAAAGGPYTFNLAQNNTVINLAGNFTGSLVYVNIIAMLVDTVVSPSGAGAVAGLASGNGNVTLNLANGTTFLVIGTPPAGGEGINAGTGTVELVTGSIFEQTGSTITAANLLIRSSATAGPFGYLLGQNNAVDRLAGNLFGNIVFVDSRALTVGTVTSPSGAGNVFGIADGRLNVTLIVGGGALPLTIAGTGMPLGAGITGATLDLDAGGVTEVNAGFVNAGALRLRSAPGGPFPFSLTDPANSVTVIAGDFYGPLTYAFMALAVDTVLGTAGLTSHGSNITLNLGNSLAVDQAVNAGATGNVSITSAGAFVAFNNDAPITANTASLQGMPSGSQPPLTLIVNYSGQVDTTWTVTGANMGTVANSRFTITSPPQAITFTNFRTLIGGAGADTFIFNDGATLGGFIDGAATVAGKVDTIDWSRYTTPRMVSVLGRASHGVFGNEPSLGNQPGFTDIDRLIGSGGGASTLTGPNHNNTWAITGVNSGTLTTDYGGGVTSTVTFAGFPNLKGGSLIDNFVFQNGGQVTGSIDGGAVPAGLADTLDWSAVTTDRVVGIAGFGTAHGYAGSALGVNFFTDIDQVIGSATTMQNALFGENQDRTWIIGVYSTATGPNVQGVYGPAGLSPALFFANFQTLVGGSGTDTFYANATPAGKTVTLFGGGGTNAFNVGGTVNSLDQLAGPLAIVGGGSPTTTPQSVSATVSCPPAPGQPANAHPAVTQTAAWVSGGNAMNISDVAGASGASGLTYGLGRSTFSRSAAGTTPVFVSFLSVETVNLATSPNSAEAVNVTDTAVIDAANSGTLIHAQTTVQVSGTGRNTVNVFNTGDSSALLLNATAGATAVGIFRTGVNSYTKVTTANGSVYQAGSGMASIVDISGGQVTFLAQTPGTGPNSVTRVTAAGTINLQSADPTSGLSLMGGQVNVGLFNNPTPAYPPHPLATAVVSVAGPGVLNFVNVANQPSAINTSEFRFVSGGATGINLIASPDLTAVYLCSGPGVSLPQATFVAAAFLLPNQLDASGRPVARIVLISQLARSFPVQNFSLPPVVASPNFANPFGFGPPSVTVADVNGDGVPDLIVGAGPGFAPLVTVFDGTTAFNTLGAAPKMLAQFFAYDSRFVGGVYVAAGHIDPTSPTNAIITGTGRGGLPIVEAFLLNNPPTYNGSVFPGGGVSMIRWFVAYQNTTGGVRVAAGNFFGGNHDDIATAPGPGDAPNVRIYNGADTSQPPQLLRSFYAYDPAFRGGVDIAAGNLHAGNNLDDLVTAPASAGTTQVKVFNGQTGALQSSFDAFPGTLNGVGGVAVDTSAGAPRIIVGSAPGQPAQVKAFDGLGDPLALTPSPFFDAAGNPTDNPALANNQGVAVGGKSR